MKILVMKFGGTSVATEDVRSLAVARVRDAAEGGYAVVVVVSAMGRSGDPYATDTLRNLLPEPDLGEGREVDLLLSCGEVISSVVFASDLRRAGLRTTVLTGPQAGIVTDETHGEARVLGVVTERLEAVLQDGLIPVVAGFQGASEHGEITTLGRGSSDTTAAVLGAALGAERVDIFTDVAGIMTADPRLVPEAGVLSHMHYDEVFQLASEGAKVIHPRAVEIARQAQLPLRVVGLGGEAGTVIQDHEALRDLWANRTPEASIVGVSAKTDVVQVQVPTPRGTPEVQRQIFGALAAAGISVDLINVFPTFAAFLVLHTDAASTRTILESMGLEPAINEDVAKVSVVGTAIHGLPGVMSLVVEALANRGITILQTSDSNQSISCLIPGNRVAEAAKALHGAFRLGSATSSKG